MKINRSKSNILLLAILLAPYMVHGIGAAPAGAQSQMWNVGAREKSQRLSSSAQNELTQGHLDSAISILIQANQADPKDPLPLSLLGLTLNMKGRYQQALDALRKAYQLDNKAKETYLSVGFTNYLAHQYGQALDVWERLLKAHPDMHQLNTNLGFAHLRMGDFQQAEEQFRKSLKANPNSELAYQGLSMLHYLNGNLTAARQSALQAQAIRVHAPLLLLIARIDLLEGKNADAQKRLSEYARVSKKGTPRSMTALGYLPQHDFHWDPYEVDNFETAQAIELRMLDGTPQAKKRASLIKKADLDNILSRLQSNLSTSPADYYLLNEMGLIQLARGDYLKAAETFAKVPASCSECHVVMLNLATALSLAGKQNEARTAVAEYRENFPNQPLSSSFSNMLSQGDALEQQAPPVVPKKQPGDGKPQGDAGF